ncbi:MAG: S8 family serine peptidase [Phycisphaerae bacterium]
MPCRRNGAVRRFEWVALVVALSAWHVPGLLAAGLVPRAAVIKPARTVVNPAVFRTDVIAVKFRDDLRVRLRAGRLTDEGSGALAPAAATLANLGGRWERVHTVPEARLDEMRAAAERATGRTVADLNTDYFLHLPAGQSAAAAIGALNALASVELAQPVALPVAAPVPPNFQANQGYLGLATAGVGATCMWNVPGGTGANSKIADAEYSWNRNHNDLGATTLLGGAPTDPFNNDNHGTAVLGEIGALNNGNGVTGIVYGTTMYVVAVNVGGVQNVAGAITTAAANLAGGDVILIEQQYPGPNYTGVPAGTQVGLVPVEWNVGIYNAIVAAVGNGIVVVEAGGNGSQNLDAAVYSTGNGGHWPFLAANDSGALIVGAGAVPGGSDVDRSRLGFSNYGSTVDLQGWGEKVYSTGYGDAYAAEGKNNWFTAVFSGTSSASPIVASACVALQSAYKVAGGAFLTPAQVKNALQTTGSPQQNGTNPATQNIGPRPDVPKAICSLVPAMDSNANGRPDLCDGLAGLQACCFPNGGCTDTTAAHCTASGGTPQGAGTTCATTQCPVAPPTQACCMPNGACADMPAANCTQAGGTPQGVGTNCGTTQCQPALQACCIPGPAPACADMPPQNCQMIGGLVQGPGTTCLTTPCQIAVPKFSQLPTQNHEDLPSQIDLATMNPKIVVADDFQSDGRPITVVHWWGSYFDPRYQPVIYGGFGAPFQLDGWLISFHEPLAQAGPLAPPLGLYFAPAAAVTVRPTNIAACDGHVVFEYLVEINKCCLLHALPDSRSGWVPARLEAFEEQHCFYYDIDIQAAVGGAYQRQPGTGICLPMPTQNIGAGFPVWGWHTTPTEAGRRAALMSQTMMMPGGQWAYGPWVPAQPLCAPAPVNMAFELLTNNPAPEPPCPQACCFDSGQCSDLPPADCLLAGGTPRGDGTSCATTSCPPIVPKFSQPPTENGADITSSLPWAFFPTNRVAADDFQSDGRPIAVVRWWGSYIDARYAPVQYGGLGSPTALDGWLLSFHEPLAQGAPPLPPLGLYFASADRVRITPAPTPACDGHPVYQFSVYVVDCCLLHAMPDSRSGQIPAQPDAFHEQHCYWYDLDVQAVIGQGYSRDPQTGGCVAAASPNSANLPDVWGWHSTTLENGQRAALMSHVMMVGPQWMYGPWAIAPPMCAVPPANMAFALLTSEPQLPPPCGCHCPGDVDGSNVVNGADVQGFVDCLLSLPAPGDGCGCADLDNNTTVDAVDVTLMVARLMSGAACPP